MLTGIAKLASEGPLLEAKARVEYFELPSKQVLNRCQNEFLPFAWTINPYRGCEFGCKYCYARYTHEFMELRGQDDFERKIYAKKWDAAAFSSGLRRVPHAAGIAIGTATDPYQPAERRYGVTRRILERLALERGREISLTTKSGLIVRDLPVLRAVAASNRLIVNITITTLDAKLARQMEPYAPRPDLRVEAVSALAAGGIQCGVFACPIVPLLTDSEANLDALAAAASQAGASHFSAHVLFLREPSRSFFLRFLAESYPDLASRYRVRFRKATLDGDYPERMRQRVAAIRERHGLAGRLERRMSTPPPAQLSLFPILAPGKA